MNVLVIIGLYPPDHAGGGLRIQRMYESLNKKHDVTFSVLAEPVRVDGAADYANVTRIRTDIPDALLAFTVLRHLIARRGKTDVVHCIGPTRMTVIAAAICRALKIPYVTELSVDYDIGAKSGSILNRMLLGAYFKPDCGIALSPRIADLFRRHGLADDRLYVRPNPVMLDIVNQTPDENDMALRRRIEDSGLRHRHLILGRICDRKNQLFAVRMLAHLPPDHGLVLAGPVIGEEDYVSAVQQAIADNNLANRVIFWGQSVRDPRIIYQSCTTVWCPSLLEGLPNVVLEGLWHGLPAFASRDLGLGGWVISQDNGAEYDLAEGPEKCAGAILSGLGAGWSAAGIKENARNNFDPDIILGRTLSFLTAARG